MNNDSVNICTGCTHEGKFENEIEMRVLSPCTTCKRRAKDNYEPKKDNKSLYKTLVISAYPCCGKSYAVEHCDEIRPCETFYDINTDRKIYPELEIRDQIHPDEIIDLESSNFSWNYIGMGKQRNIDFPKNYIEKLKELIGTVKIIFVSSHLIVREAMNAAGIEYITVYPTLNSKAEWLGRMVERGSDFDFIADQCDHWEERIINVENEAHGKGVYFLHGVHGNIINMLNNAVISVEYEKRNYDETTTNSVGHHINQCVNDWIHK